MAINMDKEKQSVMSFSTRMEKGTLLLAGDIGGTKTQLGLFEPGEGRPVFKIVETFASSAYPDFETVVSEFLENRDVRIAGACFGVAGPVRNGRCRATNLSWEVSEKKLQNSFSWPHVRLINDLAALSSATRVFKKEELFVFQEGLLDEEGHRGVIAPGTGLGMSMMVKAGKDYVLLPSEGGHADFAPNSEEEVELWRFVGNMTGHVSWERIVSGPGLVNIYGWLLEKNGVVKPSWLTEKTVSDDPARLISESAIKGVDSLAGKALETFVSILGAAAGNLALAGLCFGGVYIGGGIVPKILPFMKKEIFLRAFSGKGRFEELLKTIPVYAVMDDQAPLLGAAVYLSIELDPAGTIGKL